MDDVPGSGKTTTIRLAALASESAYVCLKFTEGLLAALLNSMREVTENLGEEILCWSLLEKLKVPCNAAICRALQIATSMIKEQVPWPQPPPLFLTNFSNFFKFFSSAQFDNMSLSLSLQKSIQIGTISINGIAAYHGRSSDDFFKEERDTLLKNLFNLIDEYTTDAAFVLHLDESQLCYVPYGFIRKKPGESVAKKEYTNYFMIAFSLVLEGLRSASNRMKIALSGTNAFLDQYLRVASEVGPSSHTNIYSFLS